MGVSGSGKSTLAQNLSQILQLRMKDGDELHLPESVAKMSAGIALDDEDRWPWLDRIGQYLIDADAENGPGGIVACSALKRIYRDRIRHHAGPVVFLFLEGSPELIRQRMQQRVAITCNLDYWTVNCKRLKNRPPKKPTSSHCQSINPSIRLFSRLSKP